MKLATSTLLDKSLLGVMKMIAIFHSDTVQTIGHYHFDLQTLGPKLIAASAHKFHGPKGVGLLHINADLSIHPFLHGGAQERNMRGGTENVAGIVGMAKALELAYANLEEHNITYFRVKKLYD